MSPVADDQIRAALARRSRASLTEVERANILRAARLQALQPRRRLLPRLAGWLAATAAVVILVVIAVPILLSSPVPVARASSSPAPTPAVATHIYSAQELSDMIGSSAWIGRTVLARGSVSAQPTVTLGCEPPSPCPEAVLDSVTGENSVTVSWRDAPYLLGRSYQDDSGTHWAQLLDVPTSPGVFAFTVGRDSVELLGPAQVAADGQPLNLADIPLDSEKMPTGNVYVVSGWWYSGFWPPCPVPGEALQTPQPELDYFCQGSWITASPPQNNQMTTFIDGALHLPAGPYPPWSDQHSPGAPVEGVFAVRSAGCQIVLDAQADQASQCPVWRLLGRLDDIPPPLMSPSPSTPVGSFKTADLLDRVSFEYPGDWHLNEIDEFMHYGATLAFVTSPSAEATASCGPDYVPGAGGTCPNSYELPAGSMVVRIDSFSLPGRGVQAITNDLANGWQPATVGGMPAAYRDGYFDDSIPTAGHTRAWAVASPGDDITNYTIIVTDNGYPNAEDVVDRLVSSFRITSANSTPQPSVPAVHISNGTTLSLTVAINAHLVGVVDPGLDASFDTGSYPGPWNVTLATESGRVIAGLTYQLSDIGTDFGGTNGESGIGVGQRLDLSCGTLDVYVGGPILGGTFIPSSSPGDCEP